MTEVDDSLHDFFDKDGRPITLTEWNTLRRIPGYRIVAQTNVFPGVTVSTIWLGVNHQMTPNRPPIIFETMVFGGLADGDTVRYPTEEAAANGHDRVVHRWLHMPEVDFPQGGKQGVEGG